MKKTDSQNTANKKTTTTKKNNNENPKELFDKKVINHSLFYKVVGFFVCMFVRLFVVVFVVVLLLFSSVRFCLKGSQNTMLKSFNGGEKTTGEYKSLYNMINLLTWTRQTLKHFVKTISHMTHNKKF